MANLLKTKNEYTHFVANLVGPFRLKTQDGRDVTPSGSKAKAILLLLLLSPEGKRDKSWIQAKLWSESSSKNASNSLRRELSNIRQSLAESDGSLMVSHRGLLSIDLTRIELTTPRNKTSWEPSEILEGVNAIDPEFEDWIQHQRIRIETDLHAVKTSDMMSGDETPSELFGNAIFPTVAIRRIAIRADVNFAKLTRMSLADEIVTGLGTLAGQVRVLRNPDKSTDASVDYDVEVIVSETPEQTLKVNIQIYSASDEEIIHSERFDLNMAENTAGRIARYVTEALQRSLFGGGLTEHWSGVPVEQAAWDAFQRGRVCENRGTKKALSQAKVHYRKAMSSDSSFLPAKISLGFTILDELRLQFRTDLDCAEIEIQELCSELSAELETDPYAIAFFAFAKCLDRRYFLACSLMEKVIEKMPQSAELTGYAAAVFGYAGDHEREIAYYHIASKLARHPPVWIFTNLIFAMVVSRNGDVRGLANGLNRFDPNNSRLNLALLIHNLDKADESQSEHYAFLVRRADPKFTAKSWRSKYFYKDDRRYTDVVTKLRGAGFD